MTVHVLSAMMTVSSGCGWPPNTKPLTQKEYFLEHDPGFLSVRCGSPMENQWIRVPTNIMSAHHSFLKVGYLAVLTSDAGRSHLWDVLQTTDIESKIAALASGPVFASDRYSKEFWARRQKEGTTQVAQTVTSDVLGALRGMPAKADSTKDDDSLTELLILEFSNMTAPTQK